jgi:hypothetical protein
MAETFFSQNRYLEELNMDGCRLGSEGAAIIGRSLKRNAKIQKLYLSQNKFEDKGVQYILEGISDNFATCQSTLQSSPLTDLDLSKNDLELSRPSILATLTSLLGTPSPFS